MSYVEFLGQWYNVVFLLLGALGVGAWIVGRRRAPSTEGGRRDGGRQLVPGTLVGTAVAGLTINGGIHDLALGDPAPRFPLVLAASVVLGFLVSRGYRTLARRYFPPVHGVELNCPDLAGLDARVVSREVGSGARSGRAQRQSGDTLHLVHCHTADEGVRFGRTVRLVEFDPAGESYRVEKIT